VVREILELKMDEVNGRWMILCKEEFHDLCGSISTNRIVKSRKLQQAGNVAMMVENKKKCVLNFDKKTS
jgi:hypothetical protein